MFHKISKLILFKHAKRCLHKNCTKIGIIGVPFDKGQPKVGVSLGPDALRKGGLVDKLQSLREELDIRDYGDISYSIPQEGNTHHVTNMHNYYHVSACNQKLSNAVENIVKEGRACLTIGGDHSIAVGSINGHLKAKEDVCILWIDAHSDINTNTTSCSGNIHGMSAGLLASELSEYWPPLPGMYWLKSLSLRNIAYIGLRSVDPYEKIIIDQFNVTAFGMEEVDKLGIENVVSSALNKIDPHGTKSIHVSFDIDSLDPLEAPSTGTPVRGGLSLREALQIMENIHNTGRLSVMDIVEVNPSLGTENDVQKTVDAAINIVLAAFGNRRSGILNKKLDLIKSVAKSVKKL